MTGRRTWKRPSSLCSERYAFFPSRGLLFCVWVFMALLTSTACPSSQDHTSSPECSALNLLHLSDGQYVSINININITITTTSSGILVLVSSLLCHTLELEQLPSPFIHSSTIHSSNHPFIHSSIIHPSSIHPLHAVLWVPLHSRDI